MSCTGFDGKIYYNTGTDATPTWVEITPVRDVSTSASAGQATVSDRRSKFEMTCPGLLSLETTVNATYVPGNTALAALRTHFLNRTSVQIAVMDGPIATSGSEGFKYYAHVFSNDFEQPLSDGMTVSLTFRPTINESEPSVLPTWVVIA